MSEIGLRIMSVNERGAVGIDRREIVLPAFIFNIDDAFGGESHAVTPVTSRHDAVEHIHAAGYGLDDIGGCTHAHEVTRLIFREYGVHHLNHLVHRLGRFSNSETADSVAVTAFRRYIFRRAGPQVGRGAALHYREERLSVAVFRLRAVETVNATVEPAVRPLHRQFGITVVSGARRALVKRHHDVGTYSPLDIHHALRSKKMLRAVDMRAELNTLLLHLPDSRQREDLKTAAVRQDRMLPRVELMQPATFLQHL